jgi:hypothetical protein
VDGAGSFVETVAVEMDLVKSVILSSMDHFLQHPLRVTEYGQVPQSTAILLEYFLQPTAVVVL